MRDEGIVVGTYAVGVLVWHFGGRTGGGHPRPQSWLGGPALAVAVGLWALIKHQGKKHPTPGSAQN
ncbi:hypothetical protein [Streptomyces sp. NPDC049040]|uniref:hypothetical protein n=1 Tax=Streptomyces sp. NPDC049040 TaxID=3365593 RepID=UPI0037164AC3